MDAELADHVRAASAAARRHALVFQAPEGKDALPWSVSRLGARTEYRFTHPAPRTGTESAAAGDTELEDFLHLYLANRGIMLTPFHNMALMCPATTEADVDTHTALFTAALAELTGAQD